MLIVTGLVSFKPGLTVTTIVKLLCFIEIALATAARSGVGAAGGGESLLPAVESPGTAGDVTLGAD